MSNTPDTTTPSDAVPRGVRIAAVNCTDPGRLDDFNAWYDAFSADCTKLGLLRNDRRYESGSAAGTPDDPRFLAVYDVDAADDLATAWTRTAQALADLYPTFPDYIEVSFAGTYERAHSTAVSDGRGDGGVTLMLSDVADDPGFEAMISRLRQQGVSFSVEHLTLVEGFPEPVPSHALILETGDGPSFENAERTQQDIARDFPSLRLAGSFRRH